MFLGVFLRNNVITPLNHGYCVFIISQKRTAAPPIWSFQKFTLRSPVLKINLVRTNIFICGIPESRPELCTELHLTVTLPWQLSMISFKAAPVFNRVLPLLISDCVGAVPHLSPILPDRGCPVHLMKLFPVFVNSNTLGSHRPYCQ